MATNYDTNYYSQSAYSPSSRTRTKPEFILDEDYEVEQELYSEQGNASVNVQYKYVRYKSNPDTNHNQIDDSELSESGKRSRMYNLPEVSKTSDVFAACDWLDLKCFYKNPRKYYRKIGHDNLCQEILIDSSLNIKSRWQSRRYISGFVTLLTGLSIGTGIYQDYRGMLEEPEVFLLFIFPFLYYLYSVYKSRNTKNEHYIRLDRRTGMVTIPREGDSDFTTPFHEFVPYFYTTYRMRSSQPDDLYIGHKHTDIGFEFGHGGDNTGQLLVQCAFLERFMDVTEPLPDIPFYEACRDQDPTTKAYDTKVSRPERYWRNKSLSELDEMHNKARHLVKKLYLTNINDNNVVKAKQWPEILNYERLKPWKR